MSLWKFLIFEFWKLSSTDQSIWKETNLLILIVSYQRIFIVTKSLRHNSMNFHAYTPILNHNKK